MTLPQVLEALIFAAPKPISTGELVAAVRAAGESSELEAAQAFAKLGESRIVQTLQEMQGELEQSGRAFRLLEQASGWGFVTRHEFAPWVRKLYPEAKPARLSGPALETLAIIAYRQPVTRADIEAVRGVAVDGVMQVLLDRSLVRIAGRADLPGRPLLYSTTAYFLEHFGLKSTHELPNASELGRMNLPKAPTPEAKAAHEEKAAARREGRDAGAGESAPQGQVETELAQESHPSQRASGGLASSEQAASVQASAGEGSIL